MALRSSSSFGILATLVLVVPVLVAPALVSMAGASEAVPAEEPPPEPLTLRLVDDRGQPPTVEPPKNDAPTTGALELCRVHGLETTCQPVDRDPGAPIRVERPFELLRVEGPDHGPVTVRPGELHPDETGAALLVVPRKASLRLGGTSTTPVTLSLWDLDGLDARVPAHRLEPGVLSASTGPRTVRVPAGRFLVSLSERGSAPNLRVLELAPGGRAAMDHRPSPGWSLAVQAVDREDGRPLDGATVFLAPQPGWGEDDRPPRRLASGPGAVAVASGLDLPLVRLTVEHPDRVPTSLAAVSAAPGTFAVQRVPLSRGGTLSVRVLVDGEPAARTPCRIGEPLGRPPGQREEQLLTLGETRADGDGVCIFDRLPPGTLHLTVEPETSAPGSSSPATARARVTRSVDIVDGEMTTLDLDLTPVDLEGTVFRGEEPAAGYRLRVFDLQDRATGDLGPPVARPASGEDGTYGVRLWTPGTYWLALEDPAGTPSESRRAYLAPGLERIDFHLAAAALRGRVVDADGNPVADARVELTWRGGSHRLGISDETGGFAFEVEADGGDATLQAHHPEHRSSDAVAVTMAAGSEPPPVSLVLEPAPAVDARILSADGHPVAGAWLMSFAVTSFGDVIFQGQAITDEDGRARLAGSPGLATRLAASGPGCPLLVRDLDAARVDPGSPPLDLVCAAAPATLELRLIDAEGRPVAGEGAILRSETGAVVPIPVLARHLASLGLPPVSDGGGRLVLAALEPGTWQVFLASGASPSTVTRGLGTGALGATGLAPGGRVELEVVVDAGR